MREHGGRAEGDDRVAAGEGEAAARERTVAVGTEHIRAGFDLGPLAAEQEFQDLARDSGESG